MKKPRGSNPWVCWLAEREGFETPTNLLGICPFLYKAAQKAAHWLPSLTRAWP
jgi:hypothetical protein